MNETVDIKNKAFSGIVWKMAERFAAQAVSLIVSIVLARFLTPDDYSVVSIVAIFFVFCNLFISSGFNTALIQKKNSDTEDYSSVLWVSLGISAIMYVIMFLSAPFIANLYNKDILVPVIRVMGVSFFISAYKGVLCAYISSTLQFKKFFFSTIGGTIISAVVGILMALEGFGPWSLVAQQMTNTVIDTLILNITTKVKFKFMISGKKLKGLFDYGWKMFVSSIISEIYNEIKPLVVGIKFSGADLAFYSKGKSYPQLINSSICDSMSAVLFPVIAKFQDSREDVLSVTRRFMRLSSYVIFPILVGFYAVSEDFVLLLLTEKWLPAVPYVEVFCVTYMFYIIQSANLQAIRAIGRSDIILKLEVIKKILNFIIVALFVFLSDSPVLLAVSSIICSLVSAIINAYPNRKLLGYGYLKQILDLLPSIALSIMMALIVSAVNVLSINIFMRLALKVIFGIVSYIILSLITQNENFWYLFNFLRAEIGGRNHVG